MSMEDEWDAQLERDEFYDEKESIMSKLDDILAFADGINAYDEKQLAKQEIKDLMNSLITDSIVFDEVDGDASISGVILRQKVESL